MEQQRSMLIEQPVLCSGHVYIFHAFDIGDEVNLEKLAVDGALTSRPVVVSKYFKNYHVPLAIDLPHARPDVLSVKIHNFGALSVTYKVPFKKTLEELREGMNALDAHYEERSFDEMSAIFSVVKPYTTKANFFQTRSSYLMIQVDIDAGMSTARLKEQFSSVIASLLRFETASLAEYQKNEILESSIGYFKGDLAVVDINAAFVYDPDYEELLEFFEFGNIQDLELRYFDRLLDNQLSFIYEGKSRNVPVLAYLPFIGTLSTTPIDELGKLKVDISVITERLDSNIRLVGEPYFSELYTLLSSKLDLHNRREDIEKKLAIVHDIRSVLQHKVDAIREDMLTVLIIVLIMTEIVLGVYR